MEGIANIGCLGNKILVAYVKMNLKENNRSFLGLLECQWRLQRQYVVWLWGEFCTISLGLRCVLRMEVDPTPSLLEELNMVL
jgi:hypothetical protein